MKDESSNGFLVARAMERDNLSEAMFHRMILLERRRSSRSRKSFMLMMLEMRDQSTSNGNKVGIRKILSVLSLKLRETDIVGWYKEGVVVGVMFTDIPLDITSSLQATLITRVREILKRHLNMQEFQHSDVSFHVLPEERAFDAPPQTPHLDISGGTPAPRWSPGEFSLGSE